MNTSQYPDPRRSVYRAGLRIALVSAFVVLFGVVGISVAEAAARNWALRYELLGDGVKLAQIGNSNMTCGSANLRTGGGDFTCAETQNGEGSSWYNDDYNMIMSNTDSDPNTVNSSTADLTLPANAVVQRAQLYWGGSMNPSSIVLSNTNQMKFRNKSANNTYVTVTADNYDFIDVSTGNGTGRSYGATANVTNLFTNPNPDWGTGTYEGADIKATTGCTSGNDENGNACDGTQSDGDGSLGNYAGWALLVVYVDPADTKVRYVGINDGFTCVVAGGSGCAGTSLDLNFTGFNIPGGGLSNQRWGLLAWDGDTGNGDGFSLNGVQRSDSAHPETNYFRSRISLNGNNVTTRSNSSRINNLGIDLVESNTGNFTAGQTSIPASFTTGQVSELVLQHFFWLEVETTDLDYGDDPTAYGTVWHDISTSTTTLFLGAVTPDPETGMQNTGADATTAQGDNVHGTNDEEGVTFPGFKSNQTSYTVTVKVKNTTGSAATLYAWIDLDRDGQFETTEAVLVNIPNGTNGNVNVTWPSFSAIPANTTLYARFRLTTDTLTDGPGTNDSRSTGAATNGEVEDYKIVVSSPTASALASFVPTPKNKRVDVKWQTASEINVVGFKVWRSGKRNGNYVQINQGLISADQPGSISGGKYIFKDKALTPGKRYFYKLELVGPDGSSEWSDAVKVRMPQ